MKKRRICFESLEDRCLLAIAAGGIEMVAELAAPTEAAAWVVNTLDDPASWSTADNVVSLREAIGRAQTGDTITFDTGLTGGTITLSGSQLEIDKGITIDASSIGGITIDADGQSRVFYISGGNETNPVELIGLTITGGYAEYDGGGICNDDGTLTLTNSTVSGNTANAHGGGIINSGTLTLTDSTVSGNTAEYGDGGGICNDEGTVMLANSTVSGNTAEGCGGGIFNIDNITLIDSTVSENTANSGGGIFNSGTLTLTNSTVSGNTADGGGGIYNCEDGTLTLTNSTVSGNAASGEGGGIYNGYNGTLTLTDSTVEGNTTASNGGGIDNYGMVELTNSTVSGNTAEYGDGGGICNDVGTVMLVNSIVSGNTANAHGGGIINSCTLTLTNSTVSGNTAADGGGTYNAGTLTLTNSIVLGNTAWIGGGIYNDYYGTLTLTNSTVSGNTADDGGGTYNAGTLTLTNSIVLGNTAEYGGGVFNDGTLTLTNSTLSGNTAEYGGGIFDNYYGSTVALTNTIVSLNHASYDCNISYTSSLIGSNNIIGLDPGFVVAPVFEDGALVNADEVDLSLTAESIAIDAGTNAAVDTGTDFAGNPRIVAAWREMATVDIGAYEYQGRVTRGPIETPSTVVTTSLDIVDETDGLISLREAISYAAAGDTITFDPGLAGRTIVLAGAELTIDKSLTIDASAINGITIDADSKSRVFYTDGWVNQAELIALIITGGRADRGGGIYNQLYSTLTLTNSIVSGNTASCGGGIYNDDYGTLTLTNSTVSGNTADYGGGIFDNDYGSTVTLTNTIVSLNYANYDSDISRIRPFHGSNNIIGLDPGFAVAPIFEDGVLVNANELDLSLTAESIGIDAGTNAAVETETDLAGNPRVVAAWREIATVDIGAYEYQGTVTRGPIETPSTIVTTTLDIVDKTDGLISLREAISYAAAGETVTFDPAIAGRTIVLAGAELIIDKSLTIDASAAGGITIDAEGQSRVFYVSGGVETAPVELIGLTIAGGRSEYGGGIFNYGTLTLTNLTVSGNSAEHGGGIHNYRDSTLTVTGSIVEGNTADNGGGIYSNYYSTLTLTSSTVSGNTANRNGGGIYSDYYSTLTLTNSTVSGNTVNRNGGGICNTGTLTVTNSTIADNIAENSGSGIYQSDSYYSVLTLRNSIVVNNAIVKGGGKINGCNALSQFTGWDTDLSCIQYDPSKPLFADPENGNYTLAKNSQAIDKGNNEYIAGYDTDLAGNPRIVNGIVDLGAYEFGSSEPLPAPTITTGNMGVYVSYGANRHQIAWTAVENASGYELAYSADGNSWTTVAAKDTSAVITGLAYGADMQYRVRALGTGSYTNSGWSAIKTFKVCPMDINNDGDITGADRAFMVSAWLSDEGEEDFVHYADINGDGDVTGADRAFLVSNWLLSVEDDAEDLVYPPAKCADAVFNEFASVEFDTDLDVF